VTNLNAALDKHPELRSKSVEDLLEINTGLRTSARRSGNGGGHNH
jgi:hypothetical protein